MRSELPHLYPVYETDFAARRGQIRQKRRVKFLQRSWQLLFITGMTGGMLWIATLPDWLLRSPSQIDIEGNRLLSQETLQKLVPVAYPQSIFQVQPQAIITKLEASAPVRVREVTRTLFPSKLTVQVQERSPVANAVRDGQPGLIDADGSWMPLQNFPAQMRKPQLMAIGLSGRTLPFWSSLYRQVSHSNIKISQIDWQDETNLILTTELGLVHCGNYSFTEFAKQLDELEKMRSLPQRVGSKNFAYIDLTTPNAPSIKMIAPSKTVSPITKP
jgi:cell division protein FtsQ